jgi:hypothetical protein
MLRQQRRKRKDSDERQALSAGSFLGDFGQKRFSQGRRRGNQWRRRRELGFQLSFIFLLYLFLFYPL